MKKNSLFTCIIIALVTAFLILIVQADQTTPSNEASHQISVIVSDSNSDRWIRFRAGLEQAAKDYNVNLNYVTTTMINDFETEQAAIEKEIDNGSNAVILQVVNSEDAQAYITEKSKKTTIALIETDFKEPDVNKAYSVTQADNQGIGTALAQMVIDRSDNPQAEQIGIVTGSSFAMPMRYQALQELFQKNHIAVSWTVDDVEEMQKKEFESPVTTIVSLDNDTLEETAAYLKDRKEKPKIYGVGCSDKSIYSLDNGRIAGMIVPNEYTMGYVSLSKVAIHLNDHFTKMQDTTVDYFTITKENLYSTENQKMIFPIVG